jgi:TatD DNase family protein
LVWISGILQAMILIDTHAHIYTDEFDEDQQKVVERAKEKGIRSILMPAIDSTTHFRMLQLEKDHPELCMAMMGVHPTSVKANYVEELRVAEDHLSRRKFVAVGETGLDFYWDLTYKEQQYDAFRRQIQWAKQYDIPVVIHSRNSTNECIEAVREQQDGRLKGVFHCFSGTTEQAKAVMGLGFYLGIGGVVTFKNGGLDKVMQEIDLSYVVLETDAPYLAPVPYRGKRNESSYIIYVAEKLAGIKGSSVEEIAATTTANARKLFGL